MERELYPEANDHYALGRNKNQVSRLESVFASVGEKAAAKKCLAMEGLLIEATKSFSMIYGLL